MIKNETITDSGKRFSIRRDSMCSKLPSQFPKDPVMCCNTFSVTIYQNWILYENNKKNASIILGKTLLLLFHNMPIFTAQQKSCCMYW